MQSMQAILDGLRLEESRDLSRYLMGLAIFLGLLGTFWGLLVTIPSVTDIISALNVGNDAVATFVALKENFKEPLGGMATSFSTSLFGLASSLTIGFLDLQAGHAQNRFYAELEEWLSDLTHFAPGQAAGDEVAAPAYLCALLAQTVEGLDCVQRALANSECTRRKGSREFAELALRNRPASTASSRFTLVAAITRTSTGVGRRAPTFTTSRSCNTRSSLACSPKGRSPTSSRNRGPCGQSRTSRPWWSGRR